jgi:hypothetical protein
MTKPNRALICQEHVLDSFSAEKNLLKLDKLCTQTTLTYITTNLITNKMERKCNVWKVPGLRLRDNFSSHLPL